MVSTLVVAPSNTRHLPPEGRLSSFTIRQHRRRRTATVTHRMIRHRTRPGSVLLGVGESGKLWDGSVIQAAVQQVGLMSRSKCSTLKVPMTGRILRA